MVFSFKCSFQWYEPGGVCSANSRPTMLHWLVGDGELTEVVANHFRLNRGREGERDQDGLKHA